MAPCESGSETNGTYSFIAVVQQLSTSTASGCIACSVKKFLPRDVEIANVPFWGGAGGMRCEALRGVASAVWQATPARNNEAMRPSALSTMGYSAFAILNHILTPYFIAACARSDCVKGTFCT